MKSFGSSSGNNNLSSGSWKISDEGMMVLNFVKKNSSLLSMKPRIPISTNVSPADKQYRKLEDLKIVEVRTGSKGTLVFVDQSNAEYSVSVRNAGVKVSASDVTFFKGKTSLSLPKNAFPSPSCIGDLIKFSIQVSSYKNHTKIRYLEDSKAIVLAKRNEDGVNVVIKRLSKSKGANIHKDILGEVTALQDLSGCRHVIKFLGLHESKDEIQIVMEFFSEATLTDLISQRNLSEASCRDILSQILECIVDMNRCNYAHRDLKLDNVLVLRSSDKRYSIRIIDFGYAQDMSIPEEKRLHRYCGTAGFTAPEVINRKEYSKSVDVFAAGCIFYSLLTRKLLFEFSGDWNLALKLNKECNVGPIISSLSKEYSQNTVELLRLMTQKDGETRIGPQEALEFLRNKGDEVLKGRESGYFEESKVCEVSSADFEETMDEGAKAIETFSYK